MPLEKADLHMKIETTISSHRENGVALVLVLWIIVLLSVISGSHVRNSRMALAIVANNFAASEARLHAEAGINMAIDDLLSTQRVNTYQLRGIANKELFNGSELSISIVSTTGLVDLNNASPQILEKILYSTEIDQTRVETIVDSILDWRDGDNLTRLHGAEEKEYELAGLPFVPPNAAFQVKGELKLVLGMQLKIYQQIEPFITVYSGIPKMEQAQIPMELAVHLGIETSIDKSVFQDTVLNDQNAPMPLERILPQYPVYRIDVESLTSKGSRAYIRAVVDLTKNNRERYRIISWQEMTDGMRKAHG
jgi:general secretion pathway protein K